MQKLDDTDEDKGTKYEASGHFRLASYSLPLLYPSVDGHASCPSCCAIFPAIGSLLSLLPLLSTSLPDVIVIVRKEEISYLARWPMHLSRLWTGTHFAQWLDFLNTVNIFFFSDVADHKCGDKHPDTGPSTARIRGCG